MSALGRLVAKTLRKEMGDVFADYGLKSEDVVSESPLGQTKRKPAAAYIKQMQKEGVSTEEMQDLGLLDDFDPKTGARRQEQLTRDEMLEEINTRRQAVLTGEATVRQVDPYGIATTPDESVDVGTPEFSVNVPDIGDKESYQEIVYSQRGGEQSRLNEALGNDPTRVRDMRGMHFTETDQLFHLRVNRGTTENEERVTNILEIQSDIQQRKQRPPKVEALKEVAAADPDLPMVENWEKLGVKEAIKLALKRGDRYVAVPPGTEIAESVLARETVSEATEAFVTIERGVDPISGKEGDLVTLEPAGINVVNRYSTMVEDLENILDESAAKADFSMLDELAGYEVGRDELEPFVELYIRSKFSAYTRNIRFRNEDQARIDRYEERIAEMLQAEGIDEPMSFADFMEQYVVSNNVVQELSLLEDEIAEQGAQTAFEIQRRYFVDDVAKELGIPVAKVRKAAQSKEPLTIPEGTGFGGRGVSSFYDERLLSPERVKNYGNFPVVTIKQYRSNSGDLVETQALDLQEYYTNQLLEKENKALSLYSPAAVGLFASYMANKFVFGRQPSEDDSTTNEFDNGGLSQSEKASKAFAQMDDMLESGVKEKVTKKDGTLISKTYKDATYAAEDVLRMLRSGEITREQAKKFLDQQKEAGNYADGGLLDEGGTVDPVSGNDVPSGSTQAEVRDDIDAKLSEGEFVFPADVTRYIGLENLMMLRQKAKEGLAKMEAMGQMGNGDEAVIPDNVDFKAEIGEIIKGKEPVEMNVGGVTPTSGTPTYLNQQLPSYLQPSNVYTTPKFTGEQQQSTQSVYQPGQFVRLPEPGQFSKGPITQPVPDTRDVATQPLPYEMKKFVNEQTKAVAYIPFMNGQPMLPIPEGYVEEKRGVTPEEEDTTAAPETAVETTKVTDTGGDSDSGPSTAKVKGTSVVGVARGISDLFGKNYKGVGKGQHPLAEQVKDYRNAQIRGIGGALLSVLGGGGLGAILGAGTSIARMNKKMNEVEGIMQSSIEKANPTLGKILNALPDVDNVSTGQIQESFTNAIDYGLSPGLAAAMSVTPQGFRQPTLDIDPRTGQQQISLQDQGMAERAVQNAFSPETIGEEAYRDMIEEAAFFDATGMGTMTLASDTGYAGRTAMQRQAETRAKSIDTQVNELASRENLTLDQARSIVEGRLSRKETPAGGIKVEISKDPLGDAIRSSALSQGRTEKEANSKFNQAVRNIARGEESRGRSVDPSNFSVTNVTSRGEINVDINGDGKADRAIDKDGNSRNYNIDRDDNGGSDSNDTGGSMSGGGFGGDDGYGGPSFKKGGLASQTNRAFGLMARKK